MAVIEKLENYSDDRGNVIEYEGRPPIGRVHVNFAGRNNKLIVGGNSTIKAIEAKFLSDNGKCILGDVGFAPQYAPNNFNVSFTVGLNCTITVGDFLTTTTWAAMTTFEPGSQIDIGHDCMFARDIRITSADWHPYYDVSTKARLNEHVPPIIIGNHVWLGSFATILAGTTIGSGSIVGLSSVAKGQFPNNCTIAGNPAKIRRRNVTWERSPKHFEAHGGNADYWNMTEELEPGASKKEQ